MSACCGRNEPARARRRQYLKDRLSLSSVPRSEDEDAYNLGRRYNLDNHFGWEVLCKTQVGDGTFPHLTHFYEKPDIEGRDFHKVTYVLYMEKGSVVDKATALKQTQTEHSVSGILIKDAKETRDRSKVETRDRSKVEARKERKPSRKRKLIHEFFYIPRSRSRSGSPKGGQVNAGDAYSDRYEVIKVVSQDQLSEIEKAVDFDGKREVVIREFEKEKEDVTNKAKQEIEKEVKKRNKADRWALRAGAESPKSDTGKDRKKSEGNVGNVLEPTKRESKLIEKLKPSEHLLKTPSGTNEYLYVNRDRQSRSRKR